MSREIKFRAWDKLNNKWFEPIYEAYADNLEELLINLEGRLGLRTLSYFIDESQFADRFELVQYTGLKDKNGKEIYEGDVVRWKQASGGILPPSPNSYVCVIQWRNTGFECNYPIKDTCFTLSPSYIEIIGNIYENKELLK